MITDISFGAASTTQPIHLDDVQCTGSESNLLSCMHRAIGDHNCNDNHGEDVGIICQQSQGTVVIIIIIMP